MPSLIDLRRRVRAVKSTQQITKAMKMIAASRLRRAQERVTLGAAVRAADAARAATRSRRASTRDAHPLLAQPADAEGAGAADRHHRPTAACAAASTPTSSRRAGQFIVDERNAPAACTLGLVGRKGRDFFRRRGFDVRYEADRHLPAPVVRATRSAWRARRSRRSRPAKRRRGHLVYNEFKSVISQQVVVEQLLPIPRLEPTAEAGRRRPQVDYLYEPAPAQIFGDLLPRHVEVQVYRALLESNAAFFAAQMTAMDAATPQLRGHDREPDALHEQGPSGGDYARDHRGRVGRGSDVSTQISDRSQEDTACHPHKQPPRTPARSSRSSDPWSTSSSTPGACRRSTTPSASSSTAPAASRTRPRRRGRTAPRREPRPHRRHEARPTACSAA